MYVNSDLNSFDDVMYYDQCLNALHSSVFEKKKRTVLNRDMKSLKFHGKASTLTLNTHALNISASLMQ